MAAWIKPARAVPAVLLLGLAATPAPASAFDCEEVLGMLDVGLSEADVVETIEQLPGSLRPDDVSCLEARAAPAAIVAAAARSASVPPPAGRVDGGPSEATVTAHPPAAPAAPPRASSPPRQTSAAATIHDNPPVAGVTCADVRAMVASRVPPSAIASAVAEAGGVVDGSLDTCLVASTGGAASASPVEVADPSAVVERVFPCLANAGRLQAQVSHATEFLALAAETGDLGSGVAACNVAWARLEGEAALAAQTPAEEDRRIAARTAWARHCTERASGLYERAAACFDTALAGLGRLDDAQSQPVSRREVAYAAIVATRPLTVGLARAAASGAWSGTARHPLELEAAVIAVAPAPGTGDDPATSTLRAQSFRQHLFERDWVGVTFILDDELRHGGHAAEARALSSTRSGAASAPVGLADALGADPWVDMGVVRSRAWTAWLYAADTLAGVCTPFTLPEDQGAERLLALAAAVPVADQTTGCYDRALRYFEAHPMPAQFTGFETAAGLWQGASGRRDRLESTRGMMRRTHEEARAAVTTLRAQAESVMEELGGKLPKPALQRFDQAQEQPAARCALAAAEVARLEEERKRFGEAVTRIDAYAERLGWYDEALHAALEGDRAQLEAAVRDATGKRDEVCRAAAGTVLKGAGK